MKQNEMYRYNEYSVTLDKETGKILSKMSTARKTVVIYPHEAEYWNERINQNNLYYELAEPGDNSSEKSEDRLLLESEAISLGIKFRDNISDEKLQEKINEAKNK